MEQDLSAIKQRFAQFARMVRHTRTRTHTPIPSILVRSSIRLLFPLSCISHRVLCRALCSVCRRAVLLLLQFRAELAASLAYVQEAVPKSSPLSDLVAQIPMLL